LPLPNLGNLNFIFIYLYVEILNGIGGLRGNEEGIEIGWRKEEFEKGTGCCSPHNLVIM
jgi:hypothetical protein